MGKDRDLVKEILEKKARAVPDSDRFSEVWTRLNDVLSGLELLLASPEQIEREGQSELLRYIPIALTACLEGYIKRSIKDLIDSNEDYRKNTKELKNIRFDLDTVLAIEGRTVSIGEFVSHLITVTSVTDIDSHLSAILGEPFLGLVQTTKFAVFIYDEEKQLPESVYKTLAEMMEMRHVFCHEIAKEPALDIGLAYLQVADCVSFLYAAEKIVSSRAGLDSNALAAALRG